jgi:hypothetical protein
MKNAGMCATARRLTYKENAEGGLGSLFSLGLRVWLYRTLYRKALRPPKVKKGLGRGLNSASFAFWGGALQV